MYDNDGDAADGKLRVGWCEIHDPGRTKSDGRYYKRREKLGKKGFKMPARCRYQNCYWTEGSD